MRMRIDWAARRKQIADEMATFPSKHRREILEAIALKHGVCTTTVVSACKEHRVSVPIPHTRIY